MNRAKPGSARDYRQQAEERRLLIAKLGLVPETPKSPGDRYAFTTSEFAREVRKEFGYEVQQQIREASFEAK